MPKHRIWDSLCRVKVCTWRICEHTHTHILYSHRSRFSFYNSASSFHAFLFLEFVFSFITILLNIARIHDKEFRVDFHLVRVLSNVEICDSMSRCFFFLIRNRLGWWTEGEHYRSFSLVCIKHLISSAIQLLFTFHFAIFISKLWINFSHISFLFIDDQTNLLMKHSIFFSLSSTRLAYVLVCWWLGRRHWKASHGMRRLTRTCELTEWGYMQIEQQ